VNYIEEVKKKLRKRLDIEEDLLDFYSLLILTVGVDCTLENVHDAWSVWRNDSNPSHPSLIPFNQLSASTQDLDREYRDAIIEVAKELN
jgi:hypothetical protein